MDLDLIRSKLEQSLPGSKISLHDFSKGHESHNAGGDHIAAEIIFKGFEGKTVIEQHRMVYDLLKEELKGEIHALALKTKVK